ncbi:MAG: UDP-N-acetylglucosamine 4,6-dehydratase, partial [bacterium]|nr:UDP-N-acetylglucosamine 4,6-dehydratase [bacterium]
MTDFFKRTPLKRLIFFISVDVILIAISVWLAFLIRFDGEIPYQYSIFIPRMIVLAALFIIPIFYYQRLYFFSWSYVSASEAISLFKATTIAFVSLAAILFVL